jgi:regulator of protease activity HflC (stomatin/prohibitin superfamily)
VLRFGRLARRIDEPGLHFLVDDPAPWTRTVRVSRRLRASLLRDLEVHDVAGTELGVDVFVEYRVTDPVLATFAIENLSDALEKLVAHSVITVLGARRCTEILRDAGALGDAIQAETTAEAAAWGVTVSRVLFQQIRPSQMAGEQLLAEVAARLEKVKARIEEEGRQAVALLHARTAAEVAGQIAEARGQYPRAVGRAYAAMRAAPSVYAEFRALHDLVLLRPGHTVAFLGFEPGEIRASEAPMFDVTPLTGPAREGTAS